MKKIVAIALSVLLITHVFAADTAFDDSAMIKTSQYVYNTVTNPAVSSVGGEWAVIGLARSGADIPLEYYERYYKNVERLVKEKNGMLHSRKYTEYSRVILALTAIGKNPSDVAGYNLLTPLGDYKKTVLQGLNGSVWALIALDCGDYEIPQNPNAEIQATREMYIEHILSRQNPDGGWSLGKSVSDPDVTAMCLQALSSYRENPVVSAACEHGINCLAAMQNENGGFTSFNTENSESIVQVIVALCMLDIPLDDARFTKNESTLFSNLKKHMLEDGSFEHVSDTGDSDLMATEQGLCCLATVKRYLAGEKSLYDMTDVSGGDISVALPRMNISVCDAVKFFTRLSYALFDLTKCR